MLIESACSVDRVEEALSTLLPMLPEIQYFRFNPGTNCKYLELSIVCNDETYASPSKNVPIIFSIC